MPRIEMTFKLHTDRAFRRYSKGDEIGTISLVYNLALKAHRWHWWCWETEQDTFAGNGFATCDEALQDFAQFSHPEPIEFDGLPTETKVNGNGLTLVDWLKEAGQDYPDSIFREAWERGESPSIWKPIAE